MKTKKLKGIARFFRELGCEAIAEDIKEGRDVARNIRMGLNMNFQKGSIERQRVEEKLWGLIK